MVRKLEVVSLVGMVELAVEQLVKMGLMDMDMVVTQVHNWPVVPVVVVTMVLLVYLVLVDTGVVPFHLALKGHKGVVAVVVQAIKEEGVVKMEKGAAEAAEVEVRHSAQKRLQQIRKDTPQQPKMGHWF